MMLFDGVLRPVITHSRKQSFHPLSFNDQQQGCLGLRELAVKGGEEKKKNNFQNPGSSKEHLLRKYISELNV